jgi:hypothetical protein
MGSPRRARGHPSPQASSRSRRLWLRVPAQPPPRRTSSALTPPRPLAAPHNTVPVPCSAKVAEAPAPVQTMTKGKGKGFSMLLPFLSGR